VAVVARWECSFWCLRRRCLEVCIDVCSEKHSIKSVKCKGFYSCDQILKFEYLGNRFKMADLIYCESSVRVSLDSRFGCERPVTKNQIVQNLLCCYYLYQLYGPFNRMTAVTVARMMLGKNYFDVMIMINELRRDIMPPPGIGMNCSISNELNCAMMYNLKSNYVFTVTNFEFECATNFKYISVCPKDFKCDFIVLYDCFDIPGLFRELGKRCAQRYLVRTCVYAPQTVFRSLVAAYGRDVSEHHDFCLMSHLWYNNEFLRLGYKSKLLCNDDLGICLFLVEQ